MDSHWNDSQPIYRQLRDKVVDMILEGTLADGDALPSVRNVAAEFTLNPLTVLKGYQQLVDEGLVEKRRGRGMFVTPGARAQLMKGERQRFLEQEWPRVVATIERLTGCCATAADQGRLAALSGVPDDRTNQDPALRPRAAVVERGLQAQVAQALDTRAVACCAHQPVTARRRCLRQSV
jgi:GntR family transcriptional regulator